MILPWRDQAPIASRPDLLVWTSLTEREQVTLRNLAADRRCIEIGAAFGFSTLLLASVAETVYSVDPHCVPSGMVSFGFRHVADVERYKAGTLATMQQNLSLTGLVGRVTIVQGYSQTVLAGGMPFVPDFAFIDGDHARDACYADLRNCERLMQDGGVICVHDYDEDSCSGVREAVDMWGGQREVIDSMAVIRL